MEGRWEALSSRALGALPKPAQEFQARRPGGVAPVRWLYALTHIKGKAWSVVAFPADRAQDIGPLDKEFVVVRVRAKTQEEALHKGLSKIDPDYSLEPKEQSPSDDPF